MLEKMRRQSQSTITVLLYGLIIFVFVFSFGAGSAGFRSGGCGVKGLVATVNGEDVSELEFLYQYEQALQQQMRFRQKPLKPEEKIALRQRVLETIIDRLLLAQAARRVGLWVTDSERNRSIREAFSDKDGRFDIKTYKYYLTRHLNTTPAIFEENWRQRMLAERMAEVIQDTVRVSDEELRLAYVERNTKVNLAYVKLALEDFVPAEPPPEDVLEKFAKEKEEQLRKRYEERSDEYHKPRRVEIAHVFFEVRPQYDEEQVKEKKEQAEISLDNLKKGASIEQEAKEYSEDEDTKEKGGKLGVFDERELAARWGDEFAKQVIKLEQGQLSGVVRSTKGFHVVKCLKVHEAVDRSFDDVKKELALELWKEQQAETKARELAVQILERLKKGEDFEKVAKELLPKKNDEAGGEGAGGSGEIVRKTGLFARIGGYVPGLGVSEELVRVAFSLRPGKELPERPVKIGGDGPGAAYVVVKLLERQEADMSKFEQEKENLRKMLLLRRRPAQLMAWLKQERKRAKITRNQAYITNIAPPGMQRPM